MSNYIHQGYVEPGGSSDHHGQSQQSAAWFFSARFTNKKTGSYSVSQRHSACLRFVDGLMLLTNCPREISFMIAQKLGHETVDSRLALRWQFCETDQESRHLWFCGRSCNIQHMQCICCILLRGDSAYMHLKTTPMCHVIPQNYTNSIILSITYGIHRPQEGDLVYVMYQLATGTASRFRCGTLVSMKEYIVQILHKYSGIPYKDELVHNDRKGMKYTVFPYDWLGSQKEGCWLPLTIDDHMQISCYGWLRLLSHVPRTCLLPMMPHDAALFSRLPPLVPHLVWTPHDATLVSLLHLVWMFWLHDCRTCFALVSCLFWLVTSSPVWGLRWYNFHACLFSSCKTRLEMDLNIS